MIPQNAYNVSAFQAAVEPVIIEKIDGLYITAGNGGFLQVHDSVAAPAAGAIPLKQEPVSGGNAPFYFEFKRGDLVCNLGCYVALSTTDGTFTASTDAMDVSVEISNTPWLSGTSLIGDLTTARTSLLLWSNLTGFANKKRVYALEVDGTNLTGAAAQYIMIFGKQLSSVAAGDSPGPESCFPIAPGGTNILLPTGQTIISVRTLQNGLHFGDGFDPTTVVGGVYTFGCSVVISSTPTIYTACNGTACIRAEIK